MFIAVAILFLAIGLVLSVIPGPAIPFFFLAGGLLATESRFVARGMDWLEVRLRRILAWGKRRWKTLRQPGRVVVVALGACCSAVMAYVAFRVIVH